MTAKKFVEALFKNQVLESVDMVSPDNKKKQLYRLPNALDYDVINAINRKGYFSHYSALSFHNLTLQIPKIFYLNIEHEHPTGQNSTPLSQSDITMAFSNEQRKTTNEYRWKVNRIMLLRGKYTGHLGVVTYGSENGIFNITDIERTLIDSTIRPAYCGGVVEVLDAFERAKGKVDVEKLIHYLEVLNYSYPYFQCIGFYLDRTNYPKKHVEKINSMRKDFDFYLTYNIKSMEYDKKWRLFYPKGL
jgi:predicted transcriptional regulator of viral defense system